MSERTPKFTPEEVVAANEAAEQAHSQIRQLLHSDTEPPAPLDPELLQVREQLPFAYIVYTDSKEQEGETNPSIDKEFLEFFKDLNPSYKALFRDFVDEKQIWTPEIFHKKIEFFKFNYSLPLSDTEAVQALTFLNKEKYPDIETTKQKVEAWRNQATEWDCPKETKIISLARAGFDIKNIPPNIPNQHKTNLEDKNNLCWENFMYLPNREPFNTPTIDDEVRFFIPRLIPESINKTSERQTNIINETFQTLQKQCPEWNIELKMGEANQITNQILAHYNDIVERMPLKTQYARTLTRDAVGYRLYLGNFDADGLRCRSWYGEGASGSLGVFALGVEKVLGH